MNRNICSFRESKSQRIEDKANWGKRYSYTATKTTNLIFKRFSGEQVFKVRFFFRKGRRSLFVRIIVAKLVAVILVVHVASKYCHLGAKSRHAKISIQMT